MATSCTCGASGDQQKSKKLTKRKSSNKGADQKNPYSDRGVEKFSALLEEVEEKKRAIYSQLDPEEVSLIRFVHTGGNKLKPVIVRSASNINKPYNNNNKYKEAGEVKEDKPYHHHVAEELVEACGDEIGIKKQESDDEEKEKEKEKEKGMMSRVLKEVKLPSVEIQPWYYMSLGGILVILFVVLMPIFGRYWKTFYMLQLQATICPRV